MVPPRLHRILAWLIATVLVMHGVVCACQPPAAELSPNAHRSHCPACCATPDAPRPAATPVDCPHCKQTLTTATPVPAFADGPASAPVFLAILPADPLLPCGHQAVFIATVAGVTAPATTLLRQHCALTL